MIEERKCTGDENGYCGATALYVVTTEHGQRFACEACSCSKEVTAKLLIGDFFAALLGTGAEELIAEEQQRVRALLDAEITRRTSPSGVDAFHQHLDTCSRCSSEPMNLCSEGAALLRTAATGVS